MPKQFVSVTEIGPFTVVSVDVEGLVREDIKQHIADDDVRSLLPFLTSVSDGENHFHIRNDSRYDVETKYHVIEQGDTLCGRRGDNSLTLRCVTPTCPGCIAKAKNIIATHLLSDSTVGE